MPDELGPLAAALAKAQAAFGTVTRDKKVTVRTKTGGSYEFAYAPLEQILGVVREPLANNGLVVVQLLDTDYLVTMLIHDSGASLEARTPIPAANDIQGYGSAVTYLRRYALQALLGIAAEEDDDANTAVGNTIKGKNEGGWVYPEQAKPKRDEDASLIGTVEVGKARDSDFELRKEGDDEHFFLGFKLKSNGGGFKVLTRGELALQLADAKDAIVGQRVTVWGHISTVEPGPGDRWRAYQRIDAERIKVPSGMLPVPVVEMVVSPLREDERYEGGLDSPIPIAEGQESFDLAESQRIDAEEGT